jgi:hypothetical protein
MSVAAQWSIRIVWASLGFLLLLGALPHFRNGWTIDQALPVPSYMIAGRVLPPSAYIHAAKVLHAANRADGTSRVAGAEAALNSGASGATQIGELEAALTATPAPVRGWLLLAQARQAAGDRRGAARALSEALILAPYDYWVAEKRARLAAQLWPNLDPDSQDAAIRQVRLMWSEPQLRPQLLDLASSREGGALTDHAFAGDRNDLVAINRQLSAERRQSSETP